ncbi:MAG: hypothetical protein GY913_26330 [Proteobacteria bacterium]|nr:hypothetical protein [Pseudomonadota bacterium]
MTPSSGAWFVEAWNRSDPDRVPVRAALPSEGTLELAVSTASSWRFLHGDEPWTVCPTVVVRDGGWTEVLRSEQPCLPQVTSPAD